MQKGGATRGRFRHERPAAVAVTSTVRTPLDTGILRAAGSRLRQFAREETSRSPLLSVAVVGERRMRDLNRRFLNEDAATDVLSFDFGDVVEVVVCLPEAIRQARRVGEQPAAELLRLMTHGLLHALGFRDDREPHRGRMWAVQEQWVQRLRREVPGWLRLVPDRDGGVGNRQMGREHPRAKRHENGSRR